MDSGFLAAHFPRFWNLFGIASNLRSDLQLPSTKDLGIASEHQIPCLMDTLKYRNVLVMAKQYWRSAIASPSPLQSHMYVLPQSFQLSH
jgi:hypothetical protein